MKAFVTRNQIDLLHCCLLFASVFLMLRLNATVILSASEMVLVHSNTTMANRCIESEKHALLLIKRGFVDTHGLLSSWGSAEEKDCCRWFGVGCDNITGHVTHLSLSTVIYVSRDDDYDANLDYVVQTAPTSNISHSLLELKNLKYLDLSLNNFGGLSIPKFIGSLSNLVYLDLSYGNFGGEIPDEVGNLSRLNHLDLSSNSFDSSSIPKFIASFTSLRYLNLSESQFAGAIPHELGNLSKLHHLDLSHNSDLEGGDFGWLFSLASLKHLGLSGINIDAVNNWGRLIERLPSLSVLNLNGCNLNSTPSSISTNSSSSSISTLGLAWNSLPHTIFDWLSNWSGSLVDLDLSWSLLKGQIPESLANLTSIKRLVLSGNSLSGKLEDILNVLPEDSLRVLYLHDNQLTGSLPNITRFSSLTQLDVSINQLYGNLPEIFKHKSVLQSLDLSSNYLGGCLPSFTGLSHLEYLSLGWNNFSGSIPDFIGLQSLVSIDLRINDLSGSVPDITRLSSLRKFYAFNNQLNGTLPIRFEHNSVLQFLNLRNNTLRGSLPSFTGFSYLRELSLGHNQFSGSLPDFTGLQSLTELSLDHNQLSGSLPAFTGMQSLFELILGHNKFSGSLPDFTGCSSLTTLSLEENEITEWRTQSIGQLTHLRLLDLSMNSINSTVTESHLFNLSSLWYMNASYNSLTFNFSSGWIPPFQLEYLYLANCKLGPKFPNWIHNQPQIHHLDFSNTQISDTLPAWFWNITVSMDILDLSSNKIRGELSLKLLNMELTFLDCSHNLMFGVLPTSWVFFQRLAYLNIGHNNFSGIIPMSIGYLTSLQTLILRNNSFVGGLPDSLKNCSNLGFADFGLNNLSGNIPAWIGKDLPQLYALILRSNKFYGSIPYYLCHLSNLHFLDLSINNISGSVPQCFGNLTGMIKKGTENIEHQYNSTYAFVGTETSYVDTALAGWKGHELEYGRNFAYLKMIDLSHNELTGEIPMGLTKLLDLKGLNLSRNKFHGEVPQEIGQLKMLESLDLSRNRFSGEIPQTMSRLNFLGFLDLSSNNFSGRIPSGTQLQGFNSSTYEGNIGLCGSPLKNICPGDEVNVEVQPSSDGNEADEDEIEYKRWLYISAALGFGTTFWGICAILVLNRHWRHAYFLFLNNLKDRIYVIMVVRIARLRN